MQFFLCVLGRAPMYPGGTPYHNNRVHDRDRIQHHVLPARSDSLLSRSTSSHSTPAVGNSVKLLLPHPSFWFFNFPVGRVLPTFAFAHGLCVTKHHVMPLDAGRGVLFGRIRGTTTDVHDPK